MSGNLSSLALVNSSLGTNQFNFGGWPTQALFWLEWDCIEISQYQNLELKVGLPILPEYSGQLHIYGRLQRPGTIRFRLIE
jgi:hypothetical protein